MYVCMCVCMYVCMYVCIYSLAPGVSFDLLQRLYKLEHHTVLCCSAYIGYMHCGPDIHMHCWAVCYDNTRTTGYKSIKTPHCSGSGGIHALHPRASCVYTSQIPHWGVLTNTYSMYVCMYVCIYVFVHVHSIHHSSEIVMGREQVI